MSKLYDGIDYDFRPKTFWISEAEKREEVAIATIALDCDTTTLYAKRTGGRIKYRIYGGYDDEVHDLPQHTSLRPFSLRKLIVFLDSVKLVGEDPTAERDRPDDVDWHRFGFPLLYNEYNLETDPKDLELLESLRGFTTVTSDFYPDLERHYCRVIDDWYSLRKREIESSTGLNA